MCGQFQAAPDQAWAALAKIIGLRDGAETDSLSLIILNIRLPRGIGALLCGGGLALSGAILQGALRNPLADPFTLGISAGAACGASLAIIFTSCFTIADASQFLTNFCAFLGALVALFLSLVLGCAKGSLQKENIILAGIAVATFMSAIVALAKALNEDSVVSIVFWLMGSLQNMRWQILPMLLLALLPGIAAALWGWRRLDALGLGDIQAHSLGLNASLVRFWLLLGASCMAAGCVAAAGIISFVGLVAPHILRLSLGPSHGPLLAASFPAGALLLLAADCLSRSLLDNGQELPVGIVTALAGAPFFAWLIWKRQ